MKCAGAETMLRAVIDNDEGVRASLRRQQWLNGQDPAYLQELADSCQVLLTMCTQAMEARRD